MSNIRAEVILHVKFVVGHSVAFTEINPGGGGGGSTAPAEPEKPTYELRSQPMSDSTGHPYYLDENGQRVYEAMNYVDENDMLWYLADASKEYLFAPNPSALPISAGTGGKKKFYLPPNVRYSVERETTNLNPSLRSPEQ